MPLEPREETAGFVLAPSSDVLHSTIELPNGLSIIHGDMDSFGDILQWSGMSEPICHPKFRINGVQDPLVGVALIIRIFRCQTIHGSIKVYADSDMEDLEWFSNNTSWVPAESR